MEMEIWNQKKNSWLYGMQEDWGTARETALFRKEKILAVQDGCRWYVDLERLRFCGNNKRMSGQLSGYLGHRGCLRNDDPMSAFPRWLLNVTWETVFCLYHHFPLCISSFRVIVISGRDAERKKKIIQQTAASLSLEQQQQHRVSCWSGKFISNDDERPSPLA